jgi:hypothetical protein
LKPVRYHTIGNEVELDPSSPLLGVVRQ